jgi:hypothetical protein
LSLKEEVKRLQMTGAKDLKISLISRDILHKYYSTGKSGRKYGTGT